MSAKIIKFIINSLILTVVFYCLTFVNIQSISSTWKAIILITINVIYILSIIFNWLKLISWSRFLYFIFILSSIAILFYTILYKHNVLEIFSSVASLKNYILSTKERGVFVYIFIQTIQVILLPVPAAIICIVGSLIYGPLLGGIYCSIGVLIGSYISFATGKIFGYKLVTWIVGKDNTIKYSDILRKRGGFFLSLAFLLPMFPDDILCLIAGITNMRFRTFFFITLVSRPIGVICMSYFGGGYLIPFSGWGIYVWLGILVVALIAMIMLYKYQDQMQNYVLQKVFKKQDKVAKK